MVHEPYIREIAGSDTVILFVHGIMGTPRHFRDFLPLVPDSWSVYNILLDGHGKTVQDFSHTSMEKWKTQVNSLMDHLAQRYDRILIAAHSMGTLFAISEAIEHRGKVRGLFLLAVPLKVAVKPSAVINSMKAAFDCVPEDDAVAMAARDAYSIAPSRKAWSYVRWIPHYLELLQEIKETRERISLATVPCCAFQSEKDELVSMGSIKYLRRNERIEISVLRKSGHFYYDPEDYAYLLECFQLFVGQYMV